MKLKPPLFHRTTKITNALPTFVIKFAEQLIFNTLSRCLFLNSFETATPIFMKFGVHIGQIRKSADIYFVPLNNKNHTPLFIYFYGKKMFAVSASTFIFITTDFHIIYILKVRFFSNPRLLAIRITRSKGTSTSSYEVFTHVLLSMSTEGQTQQNFTNI